MSGTGSLVDLDQQDYFKYKILAADLSQRRRWQASSGAERKRLFRSAPEEPRHLRRGISLPSVFCNGRPHEASEKSLTSAGIKPPTSGFNLPLFYRLSYEVRRGKSWVIMVEPRKR